MSLILNDHEHWLKRAAEARALAELMNDPISKEKMLVIAATYTELAQRILERASIGRLRGDENT